MLFVIVGDTKEYRKHTIREIVKKNNLPENGWIVFSDSTGGIDILEAHKTPSLFYIGTPVVHARHICSGEFCTGEQSKQFHESPTYFLLEERSLTAEQKKVFTKVLPRENLFIEEKKVIKKEGSSQHPAFTFLSLLEKKNKKDIWLGYMKLLEVSTIEESLGIILWGLKKNSHWSHGSSHWYRHLYSEIMNAYMKARTSGLPLQNLIEGVFLQLDLVSKEIKRKGRQ